MTGRRENPIDRTNPAAANFAQQLRRARRDAGNPPYRRMAQIAHYSAPALSMAASGKRVPTWECAQAYLQACGVDDLEDWHTAWSAARDHDRRRREEPDSVGDIEYEVKVLPNDVVFMPVLPATNVRTALESIQNLDEFRGALNQLREACGLTYRDIQRRSAVLFLPDAGGQTSSEQTRLPSSLVHDMLAGKVQLKEKNVRVFLAACGASIEDTDRWLQVFAKLRAEEAHLQAQTNRVLATLKTLSNEVDASLVARVLAEAPGPPEPQAPAIVEHHHSDLPTRTEARPVLIHRGHHRPPSKILGKLRRLFGIRATRPPAA